MSLKIEDYAMIGGGETAALVGRDGSIDWLCWPRFDSGACFANLLGTPDNGRWQIAAQDPNAKLTRKYRGDTLILETHIETSTGSAVVIDFMPSYVSSTHLVRIVQGLRGSVALHTELIIRFDYGAATPWMVRRDDGSLHATGGPDRIVLRTNVALRPKDRTHVADFTISAGETIDFTLSYSASYAEPPKPLDTQAALRETDEDWGTWAKSFTGAGEWSPIVMRSLLTLRGLIYRPSGGIVAAPTTSLPEQIGGSRNWDYRFCWLRDATFTLLALMNGGFYTEATRWRTWLLRAIGGAIPPRCRSSMVWGASGACLN